MRALSNTSGSQDCIERSEVRSQIALSENPEACNHLTLHAALSDGVATVAAAGVLSVILRGEKTAHTCDWLQQLSKLILNMPLRRLSLRCHLNRGGHTSHTIAQGIANHETNVVLPGWKLEAVAVRHAVVLNLLQACGFEVDVDTL